MKKIRYIQLAIIACAMLVFNSCETTDLDLAESPNTLTPGSADPNFVLNQVQLDLSFMFGEMSDRSSEITRLLYMFDGYAGNVTNTTLQTGANIWTRAYRINNSRLLLNTLAESNPDLVKHRGIASLITAYTFVSLTDMVGDVPFSQANNPQEFPNPELDDDAAVYDAMFDLIDAGIADLSGSTANTVTQDLFYDGNLTQWIRFGNTLKLKMYNQIRNVDAARATTGINQLIAQGNLIETIGDDFQFQFSTNGSPVESRHRFFTNPYLGGGASVVLYMNNGFMRLLKDSQPMPDPRLRYYFYRQSLTDPMGDDLPCTTTLTECYIGDFYWGRQHGDSQGVPADNLARTIYGVYPGGGAFDNDNGVPGINSTNNLGGAGINPIYLSSFTKFTLAEAALMLGTTGDARTLFEEGVRNSLSKVTGFGAAVAGNLAPSATDIEDYVTEVLSDYDAETTNDGRLNIILREFYIASYGNGLESYNFYRKTGLPNVLQASISPSPFPRSFILPTDETLVNPNIDSNFLTDQVFWDDNPANFID
ncbi:SusD/RagB family nutrient-binding outer membrane lipoprotein [Aquimarina litoralis]|uniref:SusD/RagB family nutrient-binding outer membrane lipoprotein n=1 Tax=Aquimarina litoralis TaxID=584605 RepID=UPI001C576006|nr:SusD/RagB family nutrient-binding outer membrane lipoprotein [Aquimarina litoralis]MBW1296682.1 SusD/RagB family nutrient-binding outer membrane lipoprotein [Aquimarina litoralis]